MEYYDTDSAYYEIKILNQSTDTLKVVRPTAEESIRMKIYLNSLYGRLASCIHFTDGKEKNMNKDYIVIHDYFGEDDIKVAIIFKSKIVRVTKGVDGKAIILLDTGHIQYCTESYENVIKQLV